MLSCLPELFYLMKSLRDHSQSIFNNLLEVYKVSDLGFSLASFLQSKYSWAFKDLDYVNLFSQFGHAYQIWFWPFTHNPSKQLNVKKLCLCEPAHEPSKFELVRTSCHKTYMNMTFYLCESAHGGSDCLTENFWSQIVTKESENIVKFLSE